MLTAMRLKGCAVMIKRVYMLGAVSMLLLAALLLACSETIHTDYQPLIDQGEFTRARQAIEFTLATDTSLTELDRYNLEFEIEKMRRIELDFTKTETDVIDYIKKYIPDVSEGDIARWDEEKSLETMVIDGHTRYFNNAARNLFRINKECKAIWDKAHNYDESTDSSQAKLVFNRVDQKLIDYYHRTGGMYGLPVRREIEYTLTVDADAVPAGEMIRCWIPFPREIRDRQQDIVVVSSDPKQYIIAPNDLTLQRTIYFEKPAIAGVPTVFTVTYDYTDYGVYKDVIAENVQPIDPDGPLGEYLKEVSPHIVFTDTLKALSKNIIGDETNPYRIAQKLFEWVDDNIPWASAREYSTIPDLSEYPIINRHGDCGIQTMLFITLCRYNGIPARWQSGWIFEPGDYDSMHDWGMIYFEPYGWLPMDVTYGILLTDNEELKWFNLHGMDNGRLIFNDDIACDFYPSKTYPRSETVDSQRGEVEWRGGNLYFDQWDYRMRYDLLKVM
jgi:transglutaminase-like putative cysteine protease